MIPREYARLISVLRRVNGDVAAVVVSGVPYCAWPCSIHCIVSFRADVCFCSVLTSYETVFWSTLRVCL